jgi:hypothetical protein
MFSSIDVKELKLMILEWLLLAQVPQLRENPPICSKVNDAHMNIMMP